MLRLLLASFLLVGFVAENEAVASRFSRQARPPRKVVKTKVITKRKAIRKAAHQRKKASARKSAKRAQVRLRPGSKVPTRGLGSRPMAFTRATFQRQVFQYLNRGEIAGLKQFIGRAQRAGVPLSKQAQDFASGGARPGAKIRPPHLAPKLRAYTRETFRQEVFNYLNRGDTQGLKKFIRKADKAGVPLSRDARVFMNSSAPTALEP